MNKNETKNIIKKIIAYKIVVQKICNAPVIRLIGKAIKYNRNKTAITRIAPDKTTLNPSMKFFTKLIDGRLLSLSFCNFDCNTVILYPYGIHKITRPDKNNI